MKSQIVSLVITAISRDKIMLNLGARSQHDAPVSLRQQVRISLQTSRLELYPVMALDLLRWALRIHTRQAAWLEDGAGGRGHQASSSRLLEQSQLSSSPLLAAHGLVANCH